MRKLTLASASVLGISLLNSLFAQTSESGYNSVVSDRGEACPNTSEHFDEDLLQCLPNVCFCNYGTPASTCFTHEKEMCESCHEKFELKNKTCTKKICTCDHGIENPPSTCGKNGREECQACETGHHLTSFGDFNLCEVNVCSCSDGEAEISDCRIDGLNICSRCNPGYFLTAEKTCQAISCQCSYGEPDFQHTCSILEPEKCNKCDEGYVLSSDLKSCMRPLCNCHNGQARESCTKLNEEACSSCIFGFHLSDGICAPNICTCENGNPVDEGDCESHSQELCKFCGSGFDLTESKICSETVCKCSNGIPNVGCENTQQSCSSCDSGYSESLICVGQNCKNRCVKNLCTCLNGRPAEDENCQTSGSEICESCDLAFSLVFGRCSRNTCYCKNGLAATHNECVVDKAEICTGCNDGFYLFGNLGEGYPVCLAQEPCKIGQHLESGKCVDNVCFCQNGKANVREYCIHHNNENCGSCNPGFYRKGDFCFANECECMNGHGHIGTNCLTHGVDSCFNCNEGYELVAQPVSGMSTDSEIVYQVGHCEPKICVCDNGYEERGEACTGNSHHVCKTCFDGYILKSIQIGDSVMRKCTLKHEYCPTGMMLTKNDECECKEGYMLNRGLSSEGLQAGIECVLIHEFCPTGMALSVDGACQITECECDNGNPAIGFNCPMNGSMKCQSCEPGFHLDGLFCVDNVCKCENGLAEIGRECLSDGSAICESCFEGFVLSSTDDATTVCNNAVQCLCDNGNGAVGASCPEHQSQKCHSCDPGFHLDGQFCVDNVCKCENGFADVGRECVTHSALVCGSCFDGFIMTSTDDTTTVCINAVQCLCDNGNGAVGSSCPEHQSMKCQTCDPGFHLDGQFCVDNVCKCENGLAEVGRECHTDQTQVCGSCFEGFILSSVGQDSTACILINEYCGLGKSLVDNECVFNQCRCDNGNGAEGADCPEHQGQTKCQSCEPGFHLERLFCEENVCKCENGLADVGRECFVDKSQICGSCFEGYTLSSNDENITSCKLIHEYCGTGKSLVDNECINNQCRCDNGNGAVGAECPEHLGQTKCQSCEPGFHLEGLFCEENVCKCENGFADVGRECFQDSSSVCGSCFDGFVLSSINDTTTVCTNAVQCLCDNGNGAIGDACLEHQSLQCQSCDPGFHLDGQFCVENVCYCEHGLAEVGRECSYHAFHICGSCFNGYIVSSLDEDSTYCILIEEYCATGKSLVDNECVFNQCTCLNGTGAEGLDCPEHQGQTKCQSCEPGFHLEGLFCEENVCKCENGIADVGRECFVDQSQICGSCFEGYTLKSEDESSTKCVLVHEYCGSGMSLVDNTCVDNRCVCDNGNEAIGVNCPENQGFKCESCDPGFHSDGGNFCVDNVCKCKNGLPEIGRECSSDTSHICGSCFEGYALYSLDDDTTQCRYKHEYCDAGLSWVNNECVPNQCVCANGYASVGLECHGHEEFGCASCSVGFHKENVTTVEGVVVARCSQNVCTCENGYGATDEACLDHETNDCGSCLDDYSLYSPVAATTKSCQRTILHCDAGKSLVGDECVLNKCVCNNGFGVVGANCPEMNGIKCQKCETGFHLIDESDSHHCVANVCTCENGFAATDATCKTDNEITCDSCFDGFTLSSSLTEEKTCVKTHEFCDTGMSLVGNECEFNKCTCENGVAETDTSCPEMDGVKCKYCDPGFKLMNSQFCMPNVCTCEFGYGAEAEKCVTDNVANCGSCLEGYSLNSVSADVKSCVLTDGYCGPGKSLVENECEFNKCNCDNGFGVVGSGCPEMNGIKCQECEIGFHMIQTSSRHMGCYADSTLPTPPDLELGTGLIPQTGIHGTTPEEGNIAWCINRCKDEGYAYAGIQSGNTANYCGCGNSYGKYGTLPMQGTGAGCTDACFDDSGKTCGGLKFNEIWEVISVEYSHCVPNKCFCDHGFAVQSEDCTSHEVQNCGSCLEGYSLTGLEGSAGAKKCTLTETYCGDGKALVDGACEIKQCECENGFGVVGDKCPEMDGKKCRSCQSGYNLVGVDADSLGEYCVPNVCSCAHGAPKTGIDCVNDDVEDCEECHENFLLTNGTTPGTKTCTECAVGSTLEGNMCLINECSCDNGAASVFEECFQDGIQSCSVCDNGFYLRNSTMDTFGSATCMPNVCECENGSATQGTDCMENRRNSCGECLPGYRLNGDGNYLDCKLNVCTCKNGVASAPCLEHDTVSCKECNVDDGFYFDETTEKCRLRICVCETGRATVGTECTEDGAEGCTAEGLSYEEYTVLKHKSRSEIESSELLQQVRLLCFLTNNCDLFHPLNDDYVCDDSVELLEASYSIGIGFDGTGDYSIESRRQNLVKRHCKTPSYYTIGEDTYLIPTGYAVEPVYETFASNEYFDSVESFRQKLTTSSQMKQSNRAFLKTATQTEDSANESSSNKKKTAFSKKHGRKYSRSQSSTENTKKQTERCGGFLGLSCTKTDSYTNAQNANSQDGNSETSSQGNQYNQDSISSRTTEAAKSAAKKDSKSIMDKKIKSVAESSKSVKSLVATSDYKVTLYHLILDNIAVTDLQPSFLMDFLVLPDEFFTTTSMEAFQAFIDKYGTHYIRSASFGGKFHIRIVSTTETFSDSNDFKEASDSEISSLTGKSTARQQQLASSIASKHSKQTEDSSSSSASRKSASSSGKGKTYKKQNIISRMISGASDAVAPLTMGVDLGGLFTNSPMGTVLNQGLDAVLGAPTSGSDDSTSTTTAVDGTVTSTTVQYGQSDASKQESDRKTAAQNEALQDSQNRRKEEEASLSSRSKSSKSKSIYYRVDGGTDTQFTSYFYTEEYNDYFADWVKSVSQDPKPFDLKVSEITDLLKMSAYDFFPDCALACGVDETGSCLITGTLRNTTELHEEITCDDLRRVSSNLAKKRTNLADAVHLYLNGGDLTPEPRQLLRAGAKGCTKSMLLAQRQAHRILYTPTITYGADGDLDVKKNVVKINLFLPRDIKVYLLDSLAVPSDCNSMYEYTMFESNAELFVIYDESDDRWIPCLGDNGEQCSLSRKSLDTTTVLGVADDTENFAFKTLANQFTNPICYSFICFEYDTDSNTAKVTEATLLVLDYLMELNGETSKTKANSNNNANSYLQDIVSKTAELNCTEGAPLFVVNGADLVTQDVYLTLKSLVGKTVAEIFLSDEDVVENETEAQREWWTRTIPAVPVYCEISWQDAQKLNLDIENQCIYYGLTGDKEYFLAFGLNPSEAQSTSIVYLHHNENGICVHGPGILNSKCVTTQRSKIISDSRIQNSMFVCLNFTEAHTSLAFDRGLESGEPIWVNDQLRITAGVPSRITDENVGGDLVFNEAFFANQPLKAANNENFLKKFLDDDGAEIEATVDTSILQPKYYAFGSGEVELNLIKLIVLREEFACTEGFYDNTGGKAACKPCRPGTFNTFDEATYCMDCAIGTSTNGLQGQTECTLCPAGTYGDAEALGECHSCPGGRYSSDMTTTGQTTNAKCDKEAGVGEYAPHGHTGNAAKDCPPGTYDDGNTVAERESCGVCPQGEYQPDSKQTNCLKCPAGTHGNQTQALSSAYCLTCEAGTSQPVAGQASCDILIITCSCTGGEAAVGDDCHTDGAVICTSCDNTHYFDGGACILKECPCANGNVDVSGQSAVLNGLDCPVHGQNRCLICNLGYHLVGEDCVLNQCPCNSANDGHMYTGGNAFGEPTDGHDSYNGQILCGVHGQSSCKYDHVGGRSSCGAPQLFNHGDDLGAEFQYVASLQGSVQSCSAPLNDGSMICSPSFVYQHMICTLNECTCEAGYPHGAFVTNNNRGREQCSSSGHACSGCVDGYIMTTAIGSSTLGTCVQQSFNTKWYGGGNLNRGGGAGCATGEYAVGICASGENENGWPDCDLDANNYYEIECKEMKYKTGATDWQTGIFDEWPQWDLFSTHITGVPHGVDPDGQQLTQMGYGGSISCSSSQQMILAICSSSTERDCMNPDQGSFDGPHNYKAFCMEQPDMVVGTYCTKRYGGSGDRISCPANRVMTEYCSSLDGENCSRFDWVYDLNYDGDGDYDGGDDAEPPLVEVETFVSHWINCCAFTYKNPLGNVVT